MKKFLCMVLCLMLILPTCMVQAFYMPQDRTPILTGSLWDDFMVECIWASIPTAGMTDLQKIDAAYEWIIRNCEREGENGAGWDKEYFDLEAIRQNEGWLEAKYTEMIKNGEARIRNNFFTNGMFPGGTLALYRAGDCVAFASLFEALVNRLGYEADLVGGYFINNDGSKAAHTWNIVLMDDGYYWCDIRMDHANYKRTGRTSRMYFMKSDTSWWERSHEWDKEIAEKEVEMAKTTKEYGEIASGMAIPTKPSGTRVKVNGNSYYINTYNINGNNYFQLREVARLLTNNRTRYPFDIAYDASANLVSLTTGKPYYSGQYNGYNIMEGYDSLELHIRASRQAQSALLIDGRRYDFNMYEIGGYNYFKLRDLADVLGFKVNWDEASQTIEIL